MAKYKIALAHYIREQLAEVTMQLPDFDLTNESAAFIINNSKSWSKSAVSSVVPHWLPLIIKFVQHKVGLINYKKFTDPNADILFANGGFLVTDKPYVVYVEKQTQIFGYTAQNYNKFVAKMMLKRFLRDPHLKWVFFRSHTALQGILKTKELGPEIISLFKQKGVGMYPPLKNPQTPDLKRFTNPKVVKFLFVSSIFYEKGGKELLRAFDRLAKEVDNVELHLVIKINKLDAEDTQLIKQNKAIKLFDAKFSRDELFKQFFNQCHVFAYPTYSDGFPAVINEAISAYMPIISADFFAIPERVTEGFNGFLFKSPFPNYDKELVIRREHFKPESDFPGNIPSWQADGKLQYVEDFLYDKMKQFAEDPKLLMQMAKNAKEQYQTKMDADKLRQKINSLFLEAINKK